MKRFSVLKAIVAAVLLVPASCGRSNAAEAVVINGSTTVYPVVAEAAAILREEEGLTIRVDVQGGSSGGISQLGEGLADIGMSSKPISEVDRARFPSCDYRAVRIGLDAVALAVSRPVWEGGVRAISREEALGLFEGRIANWGELGGPDLPVFVYDKEPGRGTRQIFERWAYGEASAPAVSFERYAQVGGNEEGAAKTAAHGSAITLLSVSWVKDNPGLEALAIREGDQEIEPNQESTLSGAYPLSRSLFLLTDGPPSGDAARVIELLLGRRGQRIVREQGFQPVLSVP